MCLELLLLLLVRDGDAGDSRIFGQLMIEGIVPEQNGICGWQRCQ